MQLEKIDIKSKSDIDLLKMIHSEHRKIVLGELYDRYHKRVYFKAISMLKNEADANDLTHDIFIKIFLNIDKFKGNSAFSLWVHSISVNTCIKFLNKNKNKFVFDLNEQHDLESASETEEVEEKILLEIKLDELEQLLKEIKPEDRLLLIMKYADGLSINEIVSLTKLNPSTVKMRLKRAKEKLCILYQQKGLNN